MKSVFSKNLWKFILVGMVSGILIGYLLQDSEFLFLVPWIALPGNIFLGLLQMIMVPLVLTSVSLGICSQSEQSDSNQNLAKMTSFALVYFTLTTAIAITLGVLLTELIQPGKVLDPTTLQTLNLQSNVSNIPTSDSLSASSLTEKIPDQILSILPKNPLQALTQANMLSIVVFALILGIALAKMDSDKSKPIRELFQSIQDFAMIVVDWALKISPFAVFGLMAQAISKLGLDLLAGLAYYVGTVVSGLLSVFICYSIVCYVIAKVNPIQFFINCKELILLALSTSSSVSIMPVTLETSIFKFKVKQRIAEFIVPLGATINMDGTAIYQGIATIFLAQLYGIELNFVELISLVATVTAASIGTAGTPGVGIVILSGILASFGIPIEGIAVIFGVDRFLDMIRTAVNVSGDVTATVVTNRFFS
ncbi:MAG: dicarboxylate/amino acid:cation symporter [Leptospiraceae bacterium]|jgi:Na+/H+-dicarboxylate symporter|nr:dicarboxylate/amino acid:cation symporter [Leptospiraceae bacterium]MCZ8346514.1 dicarboxylate/amino acid:cation symporter [Leptospiraceae bacterium]